MIALPPDFLELIKDILGAEVEDFENALNGKTVTSIRLNQDKTIVPNFALGNPVEWTKDAYYLEERPDFILDPIWHAGGYYVQEASSMFLEQVVEQYLDKNKTNIVLDLCAAPGGKTTHLASLIGLESLLVSNEVIKSRANILAENVQKWGTGNILVSNNDPKDFGKLEGVFDMIVVDAPCSGEGMFRKLPHSRVEWSMQNVNLCAARQRRILSDVWAALKPDGILVYSTCTYNKQENEANLDWLTTQFDALSLPVELAAAWNVTEESYKEVNGYHFYPHKTKGEGFFISAIRKTTGRHHKMPKKRKAHFANPDKKALATAEKWLNMPKNHKFAQLNDLLFVFDKKQYQMFDYLCSVLAVVYAGTKIGTITRKGLNPATALALSVRLNSSAVESLAVEQLDALRFLKQEPIGQSDLPKGWYWVNYKGLGLGWIKALGNRINNYYPKEWKIQMSWDRINEKLSI